MEKSTFSLPVGSKLKAQIISDYTPFLIDPTNNYIEAQIKVPKDVVITIYKDKAVFQGKLAKETYLHYLHDSSSQVKLFDDDFMIHSKEETERKPIKNLYPQVGNDEVGFGDYFGPIVVTSSYVTKNDLAYLHDLGVTDSKLLTDNTIIEIGPKLIKKFLYINTVVSPHKFNEVKQSYNMNEMKAVMHNEAYRLILEKVNTPNRYLDEFCSPSLYYSYLRRKKQVVIDGITMRTKGESYFPSVALSSVIARYTFLLEKQKMDEKYHFHFPFGAGPSVIEAGKEFIQRYGKEELKEVAKLNFKTTEQLL